jgi:muramoyltetrapeptide carboxypeptidase
LKKLPPFLKTGDTVAIGATARKVNKEDIEAAASVIRNWGLQVVFSPNLFKSDNQFAGNDIERAAGLQWALDSQDVKAVFIACGGYGTIRIVDKINFKKFSKDPKWIAGYSDTTVLNSHLLNLGIVSIHGTMPFQFHKNYEATESLRKLLFGEKLHYEAEQHSLNRKGIAKGELVGGNLSLLYALSGSESDISTIGKVLFIEDLDEYLYHIDRMMLQLKRSGKLHKLKGLIVGGMSDMKDNKVPFGKTAEEIIWDAVKEYNYPVCFNFPAGHIERNLAFYNGKRIELKVGQNGAFVKYI